MYGWRESVGAYTRIPRGYDRARLWRKASECPPYDYEEAWDFGDVPTGSQSCVGLNHGIELVFGTRIKRGLTIRGLPTLTTGDSVYGSTNKSFIASPAPAVIRTWGDATYVCVCQRHSSPTWNTTSTIFVISGYTVQQSASNALVKVFFRNGQITWLQEYGTGEPTYWSTSYAPGVHDPIVLHARRQDQYISFFVNGHHIATSPYALITPTGGSEARLDVNGYNDYQVTSSWVSFQIFHRALTGHEILTQAELIQGY